MPIYPNVALSCLCGTSFFFSFHRLRNCMQWNLVAVKHSIGFLLVMKETSDFLFSLHPPICICIGVFKGEGAEWLTALKPFLFAFYFFVDW